jgi:diguanylate cyclase (GGDEF)-like protein
MFMIFTDTTQSMSPVLEGALTFIIIVVLMIVTYLLAKQFIKERRRYKADQEILMDDVLSKSAMTSLVTSYIYRAGKETPFSMIFIDIDQFSEYNQAFGQKESDRILDRFAKHLKDVLPKNVKIGRYYGDQFVFFVGNEYTKSQTIDIANKLKIAASKPINLYGDTDIKMTASIGIAFYPLHGSNFKELVNSLQIAIYIIKKNGGNAIKIYSEELDSQEGQYVEYYYQIKAAINRKEFQLYYHPMINLKNNQIYGFETLIRWNHPEFGVLAPFKFLNIMEQSGDIHWIGLWGLETIIKVYQELRQSFPNYNMKFSINLSPKQMMSETLALDFQKLIKKYRMDPQMIILEVIEFALFEKQDIIFNNIRKLKEVGFLIAIDGFGLEYSTLSKLEKLPVDIIKLDNEFLLEEESYMKAKFAEMLVDYAKKFDYTVICEAIENEKMVNDARSYQIDIMQGFYFSKPFPIDDMNQYIKKESWKII